MTRRKITFVIKTLVHAHGGAERVLCDIASHFAKNGHYINVLTFDTDKSDFFYPLDQNVRRVTLGIGDTKAKSTLWTMVQRMFMLRKTIKEIKPDIVIAFMHSSFVPVSLSLIGSNIPIIGCEHIIPHHYTSRRIEFILLCVSAFFMRKITVVSDSARALYPKYLQKRMVTLPNPLMQTVNQNGPTRTRRIILNVGRLDPQKDQATLIHAFATLAHDFPCWDVHIIGTGPLHDELQSLIDSYGLQSRIFLRGAVKDMAEAYNAADLFALPSLYESFGLATAEALSCGLPAIGFADCEGTNILIKNNTNGILASPENRIDSFAAALKTLMGDESFRLKMAKAAPQSVESFHAINVYGLWEKLIEDQLI